MGNSGNEYIVVTEAKQESTILGFCEIVVPRSKDTRPLGRICRGSGHTFAWVRDGSSVFPATSPAAVARGAPQGEFRNSFVVAPADDRQDNHTAHPWLYWFQGSVDRRNIQVSNRQGAVVATVSPCSPGTQGDHYTLRIKAGVDVNLIILALLAADRLRLLCESGPLIPNSGSW